MPYIPEVPEKAVPTTSVAPTVPDYDLAESISIDTPAGMKAFADPTRTSIAHLLLERAASTSELARALDRPKGTIDHHLKVMEAAGVVKVVRTRKVRAMTERFWGRTARTFMFDSAAGDMPTELWFLRDAAEEIRRSIDASPSGSIDDSRVFTTFRHARIPSARMAEFSQRLSDLSLEFVGTERGGDTVYGLLLALYPTDQPILPEAGS